MTICYIPLLAGTSNVTTIHYNNSNFDGNKQTLKAIKSHLKGHMINRSYTCNHFILNLLNEPLAKGLFNKFHMK